MKNLTLYLLCTCLTGILMSCSSKPKYSGEEENINLSQSLPKDESRMTYKEMYNKSFSSFIASLDHTPDYIDTIYTEFFIAIKTAPHDTVARTIGIERGEQLLKLDTIIENHRHYIEGMQIIYSLKHDDKNYWKISKRQWDTYTPNSIERVGSYALHYYHHQSDSLSYYLDKTLKVAQNLIASHVKEERMKGYNGMLLYYFITNASDNDIKKYIEELIKAETSPDNITMLREVLNDISLLKKNIMQEDLYKK